MKSKLTKNALIMALPLVVLATPFLIVMGEAWFLLAVPIAISILLSLTLAKKLDTKDAVAYPIVNYAFLLLLFWFLWAYPSVGLGMIFTLPFIYLINAALGHLYFRIVKNRKKWHMVLVLLATLLITSYMYSEHYGQNRNTPVLFRMFRGDFGHTGWVRENRMTDDVQTTANRAIRYRMERIVRTTPLRSRTEFWLLAENMETGENHRIRLDEAFREPISRFGSWSSPQRWSVMQPIDETGQLFQLTTTSDFATLRRWRLEINLHTGTARLTDAIHAPMISRTYDNRFVYGLYLSNFFNDKNPSIRLVVRDLATSAVADIPIQIDAAEVLVDNFDWDWGSGSFGRIVSLVPASEFGVYDMLLHQGFLHAERRFSLDMNTKTLTPLN
ncbi:MAG: hypothetical protein FWE21_06560 [Defluviitaleaceae bacterium]|nr:hypothetical protein [Defluviitaleaceae bacterium]